MEDDTLKKTRVSASLTLALIITITYSVLLLIPSVAGLFLPEDKVAQLVVITGVKPSETFNSVWLILIGYIVGKTESKGKS